MYPDMLSSHYTPVPGRSIPLIANGRPEAYTWHSISTRILVFITLEAGFAILAFYSLSPGLNIPITLPSFFTQSEAKGFWTFLAVVWHTLAIVSLKDIPLYVFSAEWLFQFQRTGVLEIGVTDRVSKVTSGLPVMLKHQFSGIASKPYKVSLLIFLLGSLINFLGPSTISINTALVDVPTKLQIANVTLGSSIPGDPIGSAAGDLDLAMKRAGSIVQMEFLENSLYGYSSSGNTLIPWPEPGLRSAPEGHKFKYNSDVMSYDFQCEWYPPAVNSVDQNKTTWAFMVNGEEWLADVTNEIATTNLIPPLLSSIGQAENPYAAFIFREFDPTANITYVLGLSGLPVVQFDPPFQNMTSATLLICDPRPQLFPALVTLETGSLSATDLGVDSSFVGNFLLPPLVVFQAAPLFSYTQFDSPFLPLNMTINSISRLLFLCNEDDPCTEDNLKPLPLENINQNMNRLVQSAMKAFLSGFNGSQPGVGTIGMPSFDTFTADALRQDDIGLVFVTSLPFLVLLVLVVGAVILVSTFLCYVIRPSDLKSFSLEHIAYLLLGEKQ